MIQPDTKSDTAIRIRGLSKSYTIQKGGLEKQSTLAESALARLRHPFKRAEKETFDALKDIDLDIKKGEVVGIIGRNGAGKSTLLKVLSRITAPTAGEIELYGRVGSLLEVGTGFHPELTGRENIFLNGAVLGMSRTEIKSQFDAIVDFSGVEKFLDTPVKRYSSGMYVRLAFAVAAHLRTEILIVDEVLAVGDTEFQNKCLGKMKDVAEGGRTVMLVSHQMQNIQVLCQKAIYLESGQCPFFGDVPQAIEYYLSSFEKAGSSSVDMSRRPGSGEMRFTSISTVRKVDESSGVKRIRFSISRTNSNFTAPYFVTALIHDAQGVLVCECNSRVLGHWIKPEDSCMGELRVKTPWLRPGDYRVTMLICSSGVLDRFDHSCTLTISPLLPYATASQSKALANGVVFADYEYESLTHADISETSQANPEPKSASETNR